MKSTGPIHRVAFLVVALLIFCATPGWSQGYERRVEASWDFTTATSTLGWTTNFGPPSNFGLSNGALTFPATAQVQLLFSPRISVPAASMQLVEVVMASDRTVSGGISWDYNGSEGREGWEGWGGGPRFTFLGDGAFHQYYYPIDTSSATTIYRLMLNIEPPGGTISIKSIALVTLVPSTAPPVPPLWQFDTDGDFKGWSLYPYSGVLDMSVSGGRLRIKTYTDMTLFAPPAQVTHQTEWFSLFGSVTSTLESPWLLFNFVSTATNGATTKVCVELVPDAADHVYNQNFGGASGWWVNGLESIDYPIGEHNALPSSGFKSPMLRRDPQMFSWMPLLPPRPWFVPEPRFSSPAGCRTAVQSRSSSCRSNWPFQTTAAFGWFLHLRFPATVQNGYPQTLTWTLVSSRAGTAPISVTASAPAGGTSRASANILVNPAVTRCQSLLCPAAQAGVLQLRRRCLLYVGLWCLDSHWDYIRNFPDRMPVLGYYAEGTPQVIDWQIKWAVEHGIKFFALLWAWGCRPLFQSVLCI